MARKKTKKAAPKQSSKARTTRSKKRAPPARMIVRRNAAPTRPRAPAKATAPEKAATRDRPALAERVDGMDGSHVAAGIGMGTLGNVLGVIAVGRGWIGPKTTAGLLMGSGAATTAAGWYWDRDHVMAAGVGLTAAGAFSIANQVSIDAYESMERRAAEKRQKKEAEQAARDKAQKLAEARALLEEEQKNTRNGRRIVVVDEHGDIIDVPETVSA